jgi:predicted nucleic acid-binding protein
LLEAKRRGLVEAVRPLLDALRERHGFRLGEAPYEPVRRAAGE